MLKLYHFQFCLNFDNMLLKMLMNSLKKSSMLYYWVGARCPYYGRFGSVSARDKYLVKFVATLHLMVHSVTSQTHASCTDYNQLIDVVKLKIMFI